MKDVHRTPIILSWRRKQKSVWELLVWYWHLKQKTSAAFQAAISLQWSFEAEEQNQKKTRVKAWKLFAACCTTRAMIFDRCLSSWLCPCSNKASRILSAGCCLCADQECLTHNTLIPANWAAHQAGRHKQPPVGQQEHRLPKQDQAYSSLNCIGENLVLLAQNFNAHYVPCPAGQIYLNLYDSQAFVKIPWSPNNSSCLKNFILTFFFLPSNPHHSRSHGKNRG